jgi:hypothetical protein
MRRYVVQFVRQKGVSKPKVTRTLTLSGPPTPAAAVKRALQLAGRRSRHTFLQQSGSQAIALLDNTFADKVRAVIA